MIKKHSFLLLFIGLITFSSPLVAIEGISILASRQLLEEVTVQKAVDDCIQLLQQACQCPVKLNDKSQEILLYIKDLDTTSTTITAQNSYPSIAFPPHHYHWKSKRKGKQLALYLESPSALGISFGLYGLLQEQLWFAFYHPKKNVIPTLDFWPLTENFVWDAYPRFEKKGFHLHTMHPIELTASLLDPDTPNGIAEIKEYIDWLVRNQQNYFEFNLLETKNLERWVAYIEPIVHYAHQRGILIGLDISLHMTQQKAFKLYRNFPFAVKGAKKQIANKLATLFRVPWDIIALEGSTTEFSKKNNRRSRVLTDFVTDLVVHTYGAHIAERQHVVKNDHMIRPTKKIDTLTPEQQTLDAHRAFFVHTVMFYGLTDTIAPVYRNKNLLHLLDVLKQEQQQRETWYYPESSYWVTFDNAVPMYLTPYLKTRLDDILLMDSLHVKGHLTFTSGWEWGYWSIDWSIARWSWKHQFNGRDVRPSATQYLGDIFHNHSIMNYINKLASLQQDYLKDQQLIRYVVAQTAIDELPLPFDLEFQPRPYKPYRWIRKKASKSDLETFQKNIINPLTELSEKSKQILEEFKQQEYVLSPSGHDLLEELQRALKITQLRCQHKIHTLTALKERRASQLNKDTTKLWEHEIHKASRIRLEAQQLVNEQEKCYRYPLDRIARKFEHKGQTAYAYGYLYPVSHLHFWEREEQQILQDKYGAFFMSIWNLPRILGILP